MCTVTHSWHLQVFVLCFGSLMEPRLILNLPCSSRHSSLYHPPKYWNDHIWLCLLSFLYINPKA